MGGTLALMMITDGRKQCFARTYQSLMRQMRLPRVDQTIVVDDSMDRDYASWLDSRFVFDVHVRVNHKLGFAGAIQAGWNHVGDVDWICHVEDDFEFVCPVDGNQLIDVLEGRPYLQQMALRRQPWGAIEQAAGGYIAMHPDLYHERVDGERNWLEHRLFFTTNPSIYRKSLTSAGWPATPGSEGEFAHRLFKDPYAACGIWGRRNDPPWILHIGDTRHGTGY